MARFRVPVAVLMTIVAVVAVDFAALPAFRRVAELCTRVSLLSVLVLGNIMAVRLALAITKLVHDRELELSRVTFLLFGGILSLFILFVAILAPDVFFSYLELTAIPLADLFLSSVQRLAVARGQTLSPVTRFGMGSANPLGAIGILLSIVVPAFVLAVLAGRSTRGYRLRLVRDDEPPVAPRA